MFSIRNATRDDVPLMLELVRALALYERDPDAVQATEDDFLRDGFGATPAFECLIAQVPEATGTYDKMQPVGFALYFYNYSTWQGRRGIHVEDLFVLPEFRGRGIGKALLGAVAAKAIESDCGRLQWDVLEWNQPAIDFYHRVGARMLTEWQIMRVTGEALAALAASTVAAEEPG
ncbi:MAG TPA: GNAT family N-acetyltransferase [Acidobacteriaceae bacterium]|jgi:GNAT superfamily N-acetyltransferase